MTSGVKKTSSRDQNVHGPSEEAWEKIIHDLKLASKEATVLQQVIERAVNQIQAHQEKLFSPDQRKDLIKKIDTLEKVLNKLLYEIDRSHRGMLDYLFNDFLTKLGTRSSEPTQARRATGHSNRKGAPRCSSATPGKGNYQRVAVKSQWSPEIQSELGPVALISPQELAAIYLLLGDDLDSLFNN